MKEDYCSFKISKLLKEKGFDWDCRCYYFSENNERYYSNEVPRNNHKLDADLACPTHQMAMKWLRKAHKIYADPIQQGNYDDNSIYYTYIVAQIIDGKSYIHRPMSVVDKLSYEEAVEAALKYVLENLI